MKKIAFCALVAAMSAAALAEAPDVQPAATLVGGPPGVTEHSIRSPQAAATAPPDGPFPAAAMIPNRARPLVAIIDSGIARTAELADSLVGEYDMADASPRPAYSPRYPHGTMVATILRREAKQPIAIVSLRIDDPAGCVGDQAPPCQSASEPIVEAIRKATELGVTAINISLSLKTDPAIVEAVREAGERGITVVMAAGNEGRQRPSNLAAARAAYPCSVIVGALDTLGQPWAGSNHPVETPVGYRFEWQPGVTVPTVLPDGREVLATGTSMATPIQTARLLAAAQAAAPGSEALQCRPRSPGWVDTTPESPRPAIAERSEPVRQTEQASVPIS